MIPACPSFPAHAQPTTLRIWQEAHDLIFLRDHYQGCRLLGEETSQCIGCHGTDLVHSQHSGLSTRRVITEQYLILETSVMCDRTTFPAWYCVQGHALLSTLCVIFRVTL